MKIDIEQKIKFCKINNTYLFLLKQMHFCRCDIPFYMISIKTQKLLVFMILRSSKPCVLSIGGIFVSSHRLFAGVSKNKLSIYFNMSVTSGLTYYEQHFLYSNKFCQYIMGLRPYQSSNDLLFQVCTVTAYVLPTIAHQLYQLVMLDVTLESFVKVLQKMLAAVCILWTYSAAYFSFIHVRVIFVQLTSFYAIKETFENIENSYNFQTNEIFSQIKLDYEKLSNKDELEITEKYNREGKMYTFTIVGFFYFYLIATITPCFLKVFSYHIGSLENVNLTLPIPVNNVSYPGTIFYTLFIYQTVGMCMLITLGTACYSSYLVLVQHACCQLSVLRLKIVQPFRELENVNQNVRCEKIIWDEFDWIVDMFQLSIVLKNIWELIECSVYIVGSIFLTYITTYFGQTLIDHSIEAHTELCQIPFYMISIKGQKLLIFMILRSSKPCMLSVGASNESCVLYRGWTTTDNGYSQQTLLRMASIISGMRMRNEDESWKSIYLFFFSL
ncbi:LOW QUALITY PROTEIN: uncharacterized protein V1478_015648 [Vespula squamosa]|uniref:Odorant receptor n=1 Tax=Vespula squamosa TaxID=30214 RepID=A0ABD2A1J8_VESSQ